MRNIRGTPHTRWREPLEARFAPSRLRALVGYGIDGTTGMLTPLPGFPVVTGTDAYSVTLDLINQFLYVANGGSADVSGFRFDASTGGLTPITGSPFPAGNHPDFVTVF